MDRIAQRERRSKMFRSIATWFGLALFAGLTLFVAGAVWNVYQKAELTRENADRTQEELSKLKAREAELEASVASLESEFGVEAEIRDKYGFVKEGEEVVVIIDAEDNIPSAETSGEKKGFWETILGIF